MFSGERQIRFSGGPAGFRVGLLSFSPVPLLTRPLTPCYLRAGMYNGAGDHFSHEVTSLIIVGPSGVDWHENVGTNQTVRFDQDPYYSTIAFTDKVIEIVEEHDATQVTLQSALSAVVNSVPWSVASFNVRHVQWTRKPNEKKTKFLEHVGVRPLEACSSVSSVAYH